MFAAAATDHPIDTITRPLVATGTESGGLSESDRSLKADFISTPPAAPRSTISATRPSPTEERGKEVKKILRVDEVVTIEIRVGPEFEKRG